MLKMNGSAAGELRKKFISSVGKYFWLVGLLLVVVVAIIVCIPQKAEEPIEYGDVGEEPDVVEFSSMVFSPLPMCEYDSSDDYFSNNDMIQISHVRFLYNSIVMDIAIRNISQSFSELELTYKLEGCEEKYKIRDVFPNMVYRVRIARHASDSFVVEGATWSKEQPQLVGKFSLSRGNIKLKGTNTLCYRGKKSILVCDKYGVVLDALDLTGWGTKAISFGATNYWVIKG